MNRKVKKQRKPPRQKGPKERERYHKIVEGAKVTETNENSLEKILTYDSTDSTSKSDILPLERPRKKESRFQITNKILGIIVGIVIILGSIISATIYVTKNRNDIDNLKDNVAKIEKDLKEDIKQTKEELKSDIRTINKRIDDYIQSKK